MKLVVLSEDYIALKFNYDRFEHIHLKMSSATAMKPFFLLVKSDRYFYKVFSKYNNKNNSVT
jgi:hypothetical protein